MSSSVGCPTKVASNPHDLQTSTSNGSIQKRWSTISDNPLSLASPPFHAQNDGAT